MWRCGELGDSYWAVCRRARSRHVSDLAEPIATGSSVACGSLNVKTARSRTSRTAVQAACGAVAICDERRGERSGRQREIAFDREATRLRL